MNGLFTCRLGRGAPAGVALSIAIAAAGTTRVAAADGPAPDSFYVSDVGSDTVKRFDALTGAYQGELTKKVSSKGPMGLVFNAIHDLLVVYQTPANAPSLESRSPARSCDGTARPARCWAPSSPTTIRTR